MFILIEIIIKTVCYVGFFVGLWFFVSPMIMPLIKKQIQIQRFKNDLKDPNTVKNDNFIISHIRLILNVVFSNNSYFAVFLFFLVSGVLFVITFSVLYLRINSIISTLFISAVTGMFPYILIMVKLRTIRIEGSHEAEKLISKLSNQYKINDRNMIIALDKTINELDDCPYSKKALYRLSLGVKEYKRPEELSNLIDEFKYALKTDWSLIFGTSLFFAINDGLDVSASLDSTLGEIRVIIKSNEKSKRDNNETFLLIRFINPLLLVFLVSMTINSFGFTIQEYMDYQLNNPLCLRTGILSIMGIISNYIIYMLFRKQKYDL